MTLQFVLIVMLAIAAYSLGRIHGFFRGLKRAAHVTADMISEGLIEWTEKGKAARQRKLLDSVTKKNASELHS